MTGLSHYTIDYILSNATKPTKTSTRQVYSSETLHDAYNDFDVDDDGDNEDDCDQVWTPTAEDGVTIMKARFQKRDDNHNWRPPRSPCTIFPGEFFPNEDLQHAWMRTSNAEWQAFHDAVAESQKTKKDSNLKVSAARHIITDASDDSIDDDPAFYDTVDEFSSVPVLDDTLSGIPASGHDTFLPNQSLL